jgi:7-carboxy-7-deazaguanine synthase
MRLLEHYYSLQGEGPRVGVPTQFVRFAGCNLRCPGWPCDTPYAIFPSMFIGEQQSVSLDGLVEKIVKMSMDTGANNVCLTGGEPLLQGLNNLTILTARLDELGMSVEMFSNGTIPYDEDLLEFVNIVMDWKLPGSGDEQVYLESVLKNVELMSRPAELSPPGGHSVKFTVVSKADLLSALFVWDNHLSDLYPKQGHSNNSALTEIFVGPVWGKIEPKEIVEFVKERRLPWRLNLQTHKYIWDPEARGT